MAWDRVKTGKLLLFLCLLLFPPLASAESVSAGAVAAQVIAENTWIRPGTPLMIAVHFRMDPGWHIYWKNPGDTGLPTTVSWELPKGFTAGDLTWPVPRKFISQGVASYGYEGEVSLLARIVPPPDLGPGDVIIRAHATWLACRIECTPGKADLSLSLPVKPGAPIPDKRWESIFQAASSTIPGTFPAAAPGNASAPRAPVGSASGGFLIALALAFVGGLILNLMPCVLPVVSLKVLSFVRNSRDGQGGALRHGLLFGAGVLVSFWVIAGILEGLRAGGQLIGWGFQFQSPAVVAITASLFFVIALNLLDVFELRLPVNLSAATRSGGAGSFLSGLLATAVATPCTAPFMGGALGYALTQPPAVGFGVFTALGLGLAAPYVLLSALPGLAARIPKPGPWMVTLRQILAFPMLGAVIWMLYVLETQAGLSALMTVLSALLLAGFGAWIYGRWGGLDRNARSRVISASLAVVLVAGATVFSAVTSARAPAPTADSSLPASWESWTPQRVAELRANGTPVFIDFSAKWCLTCQVNETVAFHNPTVEKAFRRAGVATLRADWTDRSDSIARALSSYDRAGVPVYVLYPGGSTSPILLPELLTPGIVLEALQRLHSGF